MCGLEPDLGTELFGYFGQALVGFFAAGEDQFSTAGPKGRHHQARIIVAIDEEFVAKRFAKSVQIADTGIGRSIGSAAQLHDMIKCLGSAQNPPRLFEMMDDDLERRGGDRQSFLR